MILHEITYMNHKEKIVTHLNLEITSIFYLYMVYDTNLSKTLFKNVFSALKVKQAFADLKIALYRETCLSTDEEFAQIKYN